MYRAKNILITGSDGRPMATDIFYLKTKVPKPAVIYVHGFNGFKDWGNFDLIASQLAAAGFAFIKFNFSHNGTTPKHPEEFVDLHGYGNNNYTKELDDLGKVIDWTITGEYAGEIDRKRIFLIGHSLGGGIAILKTAEDHRVKKLITWASVSECKTPWTQWPAEKMQEWKEKGVEHITNSRTLQHMPLYYQLFEDYEQNKERLNIEVALKKIHVPMLICHGLGDTSVPSECAFKIHSSCPTSEIFLVDSDHVFGRRHPWKHHELPKAMQVVVEKSIDFLKGSAT